MADDPQPSTCARTASSCATGTVHGAHTFTISQYSLVRDLPPGESVVSGTFSVGGYDWALLCYPNGDMMQYTQYFLTVYLVLVTANAEARASYDISLVDPTTGAGSPPASTEGKLPMSFISSPSLFQPAWGRPFGTTKWVEEAGYVHGGSLSVECVLSVVGQTRTSETRRVPHVEVPPPDMPGHLARLLRDEENADVTFDVRGERFRAHRSLLALRSPVFQAELYGPMRDDQAAIPVGDMQPEVFRALLHFIYTDSLPAMDDLGEDNRREAVRHLLVAGDRYDVERLRLLCESTLCASLDARSVVDTLALANRHRCETLKDACVEFIVSSGIKLDVARTPDANHADVVASQEDDDRITCASVVEYVCKEISRILFRKQV